MTETPPSEPARQPVFNALPGVIALLALTMLGVHLLDAWAVGQGADGVHSVIYNWAVLRTGPFLTQFPTAPVWGTSPYLLHVFVHFGWLHLFVNLGALLAFGAAALRPFGQGLRANLGFLSFFFACAIAGAGLSSLVHANDPQLMAGSSTAISGLVAAAGWASGGRAGMLRLGGPWLAMNLAMAVADQLFAIPISWSGHIGGLLVGMIAYPLFVALFRAS